MAQFQLSELLTGLKRIFVAVQGKKSDSTYVDLKVADSGELITKSVGSPVFKAEKAVVTAAGTRVKLPAYACSKVTIVALKGNNGSIFVGGDDVSSTIFGAELEAKDSITLEVSNANLISINASISGEGVSYVAI